MRATPPEDITLPQFTLVFAPFGLLAIFALLWPELSPDGVDLGRTKATIWVTSIMLIPAFALYPFAALSQRVANLAHLFWTFAYLLFLIHAYWAVFIIFDGIRDTFRQMGMLIASVNFLLVFLWGLDVVLLWAGRSKSPAAARFQLYTRIFALLVFVITLIFLRDGPVRSIGIALATAAILAGAVRFLARERDPSYAAAE